MQLLGLDEAALGPSLGPFCACLTTFSLPHREQTDPDLYRILSDFISRDKNIPEHLAVADSKVLYTPSTGIGTLERGITAFLEAADLNLPCSFTDLLSALTPPEDLKSLEDIPWYEKAGEFSIPWETGPLCASSPPGHSTGRSHPGEARAER